MSRPTPLYIVREVTFRTLRAAIALHARTVGERSIRITWEK